MTSVVALIIVLLVALAWVVVRRRWVIVTVRGVSMAPTLENGQRLLVRRQTAPPYSVGEIVVFPVAHPDPAVRARVPRLRVKRVVATEGDPMPSWMHERVGRDSFPRDSGLVPGGYVVVAGDNKRSEDSRHFGLVDASAVIGAVKLREGRSILPK